MPIILAEHQVAGFVVFPGLRIGRAGQFARVFVQGQYPYPIIAAAPCLGGDQQPFARPVQHAGMGVGDAAGLGAFEMLHADRFAQAPVGPDGQAGHRSALETGHQQELIVRGHHAIHRVLPLAVHRIQEFQVPIFFDAEGTDFMGIPMDGIKIFFCLVQYQPGRVVQSLRDAFQLPVTFLVDGVAGNALPVGIALRRGPAAYICSSHFLRSFLDFLIRHPYARPCHAQQHGGQDQAEPAAFFHFLFSSASLAL